MIVKKIDTVLYYLMLLFALCSSVSAMGERNSLYLAVFLLLIRYGIEPFKITIDRDICKAMGILIGTIFVVSFFSSYPIDSFKQLARTFLHFAPLILVASIVKNKRQLYSLFTMMILSIIVNDGYAIWQGLHGNFRAQGFTTHPMHLAGILVQVIPIFLIMGLKESYSTLMRTCFLSVSILSSVALMFNGTRGAWIAIVVTILIYALLVARYNRKSFCIAITVVVALGLLTMTVPALKNRVGSIGDMNYQSNSERLLLWKSAGNMFYDHPLVGVGFGQFKDVYNSQYISPLAKEPGLPHAHNNFMQVVAETGIAGLASFMYLFWTILTRSYKRYAAKVHDDRFLAVFLATIGLLVQGLTEYNFGSLQVMHTYWLIVALGYCNVLGKQEGESN